MIRGAHGVLLLCDTVQSVDVYGRAHFERMGYGNIHTLHTPAVVPMYAPFVA